MCEGKLVCSFLLLNEIKIIYSQTSLVVKSNNDFPSLIVEPSCHWRNKKSFLIYFSLFWFLGHIWQCSGLFLVLYSEYSWTPGTILGAGDGAQVRGRQYKLFAQCTIFIPLRCHFLSSFFFLILPSSQKVGTRITVFFSVAIYFTYWLYCTLQRFSICVLQMNYVSKCIFCPSLYLL